MYRTAFGGEWKSYKGERSQSLGDAWQMGRDENHCDRGLTHGQLMGTGGANAIGLNG